MCVCEHVHAFIFIFMFIPGLEESVTGKAKCGKLSSCDYGANKETRSAVSFRLQCTEWHSESTLIGGYNNVRRA